MMQRDQEEILAPIKAAHLPIMITQGDQDPVVPVANTRTWAEAMDELGMEHEYIEMAGRDHGNIIWDGMPAIFRFFAAHTRTPKVWTPRPGHRASGPVGREGEDRWLALPPEAIALS